VGSSITEVNLAICLAFIIRGIFLLNERGQPRYSNAEARLMENTLTGLAVHVSQSRVESLKRAIHGQSFSNFPAIFRGFAAKGIPESEIKPRENVFTYQAWRALGRQVRRGEHGVKVVTFIETKSKKVDTDAGERKIIRRPWTTTVFHISQTEEMSGGAA
jgi:hypothetical protein